MQLAPKERQHLVPAEICEFRQLGILVHIRDPIVDIVYAAPPRPPPIVRHGRDIVFRGRYGTDSVRHLPQRRQPRLRVGTRALVVQILVFCRHEFAHPLANDSHSLKRVRGQLQERGPVRRVVPDRLLEVRANPPYAVNGRTDDFVLNADPFFHSPEEPQVFVTIRRTPAVAWGKPTQNPVLLADEKHLGRLQANIPPLKQRLPSHNDRIRRPNRDFVFYRFLNPHKHVVVRQGRRQPVGKSRIHVTERGDNRTFATTGFRRRLQPVFRPLPGKPDVGNKEQREQAHQKPSAALVCCLRISCSSVQAISPVRKSFMFSVNLK